MKKLQFLPFLTLLFLLNITSIFPLPKPKSENIGALVGKVCLDLENDWEMPWGVMRKGEYYKGLIYIKNNETGKEYQIISNLNGVYYLLNIPVGKYTIFRFIYKFNTASGWYRIPSNFTQYVEILPNKITVLKTILIKRSLLLFDEKKHRKSSNEVTQPMTQSIIIKDEMDIIKDLFKKLDRNNRWGSFEWYENN